MNRNEAPQQLLNRLPKKWALAIVAVLIGYALLQPMVNSWLGWKLPSLAGLAGNETPQVIQGKATGGAEAGSRTKASVSASEAESSAEAEPSKSGAAESLRDDTPDSSQPKQSKSGAAEAVRDKAFSQQASSKEPVTKQEQTSSKQSATKQEQASSKQPSNQGDAADLLYGLLKDAGREVYVSPAGLRYTRGSEEGHRLKHIEKHLKDQPDRPGKHGVFDGDMAQVLRWIDDAYTRSKQGAKGVRKRDEDGRTVIEAPFTKPIGFVGGRDGKRTNNPEAKRLRLVVEDDRVITAFPF